MVPGIRREMAGEISFVKVNSLTPDGKETLLSSEILSCWLVLRNNQVKLILTPERPNEGWRAYSAPFLLRKTVNTKTWVLAKFAFI